MSRIDGLIAELCPHGVEVKRLGELATYTRGLTYAKSDEALDGPIRVLRSNNITLATNALNFDEVKTISSSVRVRDDQWLKANDILISAASGSMSHVGKVAFITDDLGCCFGGFMAVLRSRGELNARFLFHVLAGTAFKAFLESVLATSTINNLSSSIVGAFDVPVPPFEVQLEVVRTLDTFIQLEAELEAELAAELEARRRQLDFYRESLFACGESPTRAMGDVGSFFRGRRFTKNDVVPSGIGSIHYGEIYTSYGVSADRAFSHVRQELKASLRFARPGDVVIAAVGETVEDVCKAVAWLGDDDVAIHDDCFAYRHTLNPKFVAYYLQTSMFHREKNKHVARAKVKRISGEALAKMSIPVPSLEEQERVVAVLDRFDALVNDVTVGLAAELAARRQQYAYYRDRLLTFDQAV